MKKLVDPVKEVLGTGRSVVRDGFEYPDPTPLEVPLDFRRPIPLSEEVRRLMEDERLKQDLGRAGVETFEEADDFDIADDPVDGTPWEEGFEPRDSWIRDNEIRSGIVSEPDYLKAKDLVGKAQVALKAWEDKSKAGAAPANPKSPTT